MASFSRPLAGDKGTNAPDRHGASCRRPCLVGVRFPRSGPWVRISTFVAYLRSTWTCQTHQLVRPPGTRVAARAVPLHGDYGPGERNVSCPPAWKASGRAGDETRCSEGARRGASGHGPVRAAWAMYGPVAPATPVPDFDSAHVVSTPIPLQRSGVACPRYTPTMPAPSAYPQRSRTPFQSWPPPAAAWPPTARAALSSPRLYTAPSLSLCPPCFRLLLARSPPRRAGRRRTRRRARSHRAAQPSPPQLVCPQDARVARARSPRGDGRAPAPALSLGSGRPAPRCSSSAPQQSCAPEATPLKGPTLEPWF